MAAAKKAVADDDDKKHTIKVSVTAEEYRTLRRAAIDADDRGPGAYLTRVGLAAAKGTK